jgi:hypothetical protein
VDYVKFHSRSHDAIIRVFDESGALIETHEHVAISNSGKARAAQQLFTNSDSVLDAPRPGADSSAPYSNIGSSAHGCNRGSSGLGNNKPKLAPEENRQHRARQQTLAEEGFS